MGLGKASQDRERQTVHNLASWMHINLLSLSDTTATCLHTISPNIDQSVKMVYWPPVETREVSDLYAYNSIPYILSTINTAASNWHTRDHQSVCVRGQIGHGSWSNMKDPP